jgi:hypothetical protein
LLCYNFEALNCEKQLEKSQKGEGIKLLHPKGKAKPCGTIFIRLVAIPRFSEDEIASNLQVNAPHAPRAASLSPLALQSPPPRSPLHVPHPTCLHVLQAAEAALASAAATAAGKAQQMQDAGAARARRAVPADSSVTFLQLPGRRQHVMLR